MSRRQPRFHPRLAVDLRCRLLPGGTVYRVARVTPCGAYLRAVYEVARLVELPNGRTFMARESGDAVTVSVHAAVYPE